MNFPSASRLCPFDRAKRSWWSEKSGNENESGPIFGFQWKTAKFENRWKRKAFVSPG